MNQVKKGYYLFHDFPSHKCKGKTFYFGAPCDILKMVTFNETMARGF